MCLQRAQKWCSLNTLHPLNYALLSFQEATTTPRRNQQEQGRLEDQEQGQLEAQEQGQLDQDQGRPEDQDQGQAGVTGQ